MIITAVITNDRQADSIRQLMDDRHLTATVQFVHADDAHLQPPIGRQAIQDLVVQRATHGLHRQAESLVAVSLQAGIDTQPEGMLLVCAAYVVARSGFQSLGWSQPRRLPDVVATGVAQGHPLDQLLDAYRHQWRPDDTVLLPDLDELATRRQSYSEALTAAFDGLPVPLANRE